LPRFFQAVRYAPNFGLFNSKPVGGYEDGSGIYGFIYEIPEPATLLLLGLGAVTIQKSKCKN